MTGLAFDDEAVFFSPDADEPDDFSALLAEEPLAGDLAELLDGRRVRVLLGLRAAERVAHGARTGADVGRADELDRGRRGSDRGRERDGRIRRVGAGAGAAATDEQRDRNGRHDEHERDRPQLLFDEVGEQPL